MPLTRLAGSNGRGEVGWKAVVYEHQSGRSGANGYSITSSARASRTGGISRPSAFAVLRLMINSNLVDCMTGRSAGWYPSRRCPYTRQVDGWRR